MCRCMKSHVGLHLTTPPANREKRLAYLLDQLDQLEREALAALQKVEDSEALAAWRRRYVGGSKHHSVPGARAGSRDGGKQWLNDDLATAFTPT